MLKKHETVADYEGVGVYEHVAPGARLAEEYVWGVYAPSGIGTTAGADELLSALTVTEDEGGLVAIREDKRALAVQTLDMMYFQRDSESADPMTGQASFVIVAAGGNWVGGYVDAGYMIMVNLSSVATMNPRIMMTREPKTIAQYATREGGYAMVTGPSELAVAALQIKQAQAPPVPGRCPEGTYGPRCLPVSTAPAQQSPVLQAKAPSWLLPVAIGAAVITAGALLLKG